MVRKRYRIYRYLIASFITLFIAGAAVSAVILNNGDENETCTLDIVIERSIDSDGREYEVSSFSLTLSSGEGQTTTFTLPKDVTATTRNLSFEGEWKIEVEALNSSGTVIGRGVSEAFLSYGESASVNILLEKVSLESGSLTLDIEGEGSYVVRIYNGNLEESIDEVKVEGPGKGSIALEEGVYTFMILSKFNNSTVLASEKFEIREGEEIFFSYVPSDDRSLILTDASASADGLDILLSEPVVRTGESLTLTADGADDESNCEWFIDGVKSPFISHSIVLEDLTETGEKKILVVERDSSTGLVRTASRNIKVHEKDYVTKVGFVVINDESDQGYTMNFLDSMDKAAALLEEDGYRVKVVTKKGVTESDSAREANDELASDGCEIIFNNSYGFEPYMLSVADAHPDTLFVSITNSEGQSDGRDNTYNAYAAIYEGRYLTGVAAGMKLNELIQEGLIKEDEAVVGYVATYALGEVVSGMTAYYLGVRSVCPEARMLVFFVDAWSDMTLEEAAANSLIDSGAVIISQHSDTTAPALTAQKKGVFHTGYNADMTAVAPLSSIISCRIDWTGYFYTFIRNYLDGVENPSDWTGTLENGDVVLTPLNESIAAPGTREALEKVKEALVNGTLHVFDTSSFTVNGEVLTHMYALDTDGDYVPDSGEAVWDGVFHESYPEYQSSPYFREVIDGITWLNNPVK